VEAATPRDNPEDGGAMASTTLQPQAIGRGATKDVELTGRSGEASPRSRGYVRGAPAAPAKYAKNPLQKN